MDIITAILDFVLLVMGNTLEGVLEVVAIMLGGCFILALFSKVLSTVGRSFTFLLRRFKRLSKAL